MIKCIQIRKLFGRFNYNISMNSTGVTIITGPNGFGKSTLLRTINALSSGDIGFFMKLDFFELIVLFDNGKSLAIQKSNKSIRVDEVSIPLFNEKQLAFLQRQPRTQINNSTDWKNSDTLPDYESVMNYFIEYRYSFGDIALKEKDRQALQKIKKKLELVKGWCGDVRFISDQRLIRTEQRQPGSSKGQEVVDVIRELPKRLKSKISKVSEEYSRVANTLDGSYPKRLFAAQIGIKNQSDYELRLKEANEKFEKLRKYNLVDISIINEEKYNESYSTALKIYFDDFAEKFKVFQDLISKLDLFTKIVNSRLTFKHLRITRENGFEIVDNDNPEKVLRLSQLSSGEKQEIVLFYELIFDSGNNLFLLIDEPEISLHITWQKQFLNDLLEVSKLIQLRAIVATHSPQIVSNHLDIQIDLGELYGKELNTQ